MNCSVLQIEPKSIHLVGYVENILRWNEILKNLDLHVMYNVLGIINLLLHFPNKYKCIGKSPRPKNFRMKKSLWSSWGNYEEVHAVQ